MSRPPSRTTRSASASTAGAARSTRRAWTIQVPISRRWKIPKRISMTGSTLVSTEELSRGLASWRVFDCRHDLAKPELGEAHYREGHIPGALFAHLERDLSAPKSGKNGRHPLPDPEQFGQFLGRSGVQPSDRVVCYDAANGAMAARLWWLLRWVGHEKVAVLDGGFAKWTREGRPATADVLSFAATAYPLQVNEELAVSVRTVQRRLGRQLLLDARAPA